MSHGKQSVSELAEVPFRHSSFLTTSDKIFGKATAFSKNNLSLSKCFFFFLNFLFCVGVQLNNNAVIVSGEEWGDSATHTRVSDLPQTPLLPMVPQNTEQVPMLHSRSLLVIHFKYSKCVPGHPNRLNYCWLPSYRCGQSQVCSLSLGVCFCFVGKFVCFISF